MFKYLNVFLSKMEQKRRIYELAEQGLNTQEIKNMLNEEFGKHAYSISSVYLYLKNYKLGTPLKAQKGKPGPKPDEQLIIRITQILDAEPFATTRSIADKLHESKTTIWRYLVNEMNYTYKATNWVPHFLTDCQKEERIKQAESLSNILKQCHHESFRNILTGDESWFHFRYYPKGSWCLVNEESASFEKQTIQVKKMMFTIIWGVHDFYIVDVLPEGTTFNSSYFIEHILKPLSMKREVIWSQATKKLIWLHLDNCRIHNSKSSNECFQGLGFKRTPHPPYSPDIAPSDFYLFGYIKERLKGCFFDTVEDLREKILMILREISEEKRKEVFLTWIRRCDWVVSHEGSYYKE